MKTKAIGPRKAIISSDGNTGLEHIVRARFVRRRRLLFCSERLVTVNCQCLSVVRPVVVQYGIVLTSHRVVYAGALRVRA